MFRVKRLNPRVDVHSILQQYSMKLPPRNSIFPLLCRRHGGRRSRRKLGVIAPVGRVHVSSPCGFQPGVLGVRSAGADGAAHLAPEPECDEGARVSGHQDRLEEQFLHPLNLEFRLDGRRHQVPHGLVRLPPRWRWRGPGRASGHRVGIRIIPIRCRTRRGATRTVKTQVPG